MKKLNLDQEEQEILASYERGEWKPIKNQKLEIEKYKGYAKNTLLKNKRVNIRISSKDLDDLQTIAIEDGIPYQTLMSSILHRYVSGRLVDTGRSRKILK